MRANEPAVGLDRFDDCALFGGGVVQIGWKAMKYPDALKFRKLGRRQCKYPRESIVLVEEARSLGRQLEAILIGRTALCSGL